LRTFIAPSSAVVVALCAAAAATTAFAQQAVPARDDAWRFEVTPYLFAPVIQGSAQARGINSEVDASFSDILNHLDSGFTGLLEARKGSWLFAVDAIYTKLSDEPAKSWTGPLGNSNTAELKLTFKQYIYQFSAGRRVLDERTKLDVFGSARYTKLDATAALTVETGSPLLPDGSRSSTRNKAWWDPVVGARVTTPLAERWAGVGYLDAGGTGSSQYSYQAYLGASWNFHGNLTGKLGYRYLHQKYEKDDFEWDIRTQGPFLGLGIAF
jgi:hypothetical protein